MKFIILVFVVTLIISSYYLVKDFLEYKSSNDDNKELVKDVIDYTDNKEEKEDKIMINWDRLYEINKDIIGWIKIENTNINYPILKDDENLKYLKHSYNEKHNNNGSIFTLNADPFNDENTVIYGHNMKNGTMFSELSKYMNKNFFDEHSTILIYTKNQNYKATVFSCYSIGVNQEEKNIKELGFEDEIEYYKKANKYKVNNMENIKKIIKLSTCSYLNNHTTPTNQRYYIIAMLEKVE